MAALVVTTAPASEPVTLTEAKAHLRVDHTDDDSLITDLIQEAREFVESFTWRALIQQTITEYFDGFPSWFRLQRAPLQSVNSIKYLDENGTEQTLASSQYRVDTASTPARVTLAYDVATWPTVRGVTNDVYIEYVAGYADADSVPMRIKQAMLLIIGDRYERAEDAIIGTIIARIPNNAELALRPYQVRF